MARTMDLRKTRNDFIAVLDKGDEAWEASQDAAPDRRKTVAEDIFLRFVVGWELFISEWFIGCVNHDAARYKKAFEKRMKNWLDKQVAKQYDRYDVTFPKPTLALPRQPKLADVRELLDPTERNIEFDSMQDLAKRAGEELAPKYTARAAAVISSGGDEIVDASLAIRNVLAHRSRRAVIEMNRKVAAFPSYPDLRKQTMSRDGLGTYLNTKTSSGEARVAVFQRELERVSRLLVP